MNKNNRSRENKKIQESMYKFIKNVFISYITSYFHYLNLFFYNSITFYLILSTFFLFFWFIYCLPMIFWLIVFAFVSSFTKNIAISTLIIKYLTNNWQDVWSIFYSTIKKNKILAFFLSIKPIFFNILGIQNLLWNFSRITHLADS